MLGRSRAEKKASALLRAQLSLKHALERIDYQEDVIKPKLMEIRQLGEGNTVEVAGALEIGEGAGDAEDHGDA